MIILYLLVFFLGASLGSFSGVLLDRLPRKESIINPPSHCPNCKYELKFYENIPIVSYVFLRGKCSNCGIKIPLRFLLVEIACGALAVLIFSVISVKIF